MKLVLARHRSDACRVADKWCLLHGTWRAVQVPSDLYGWLDGTDVYIDAGWEAGRTEADIKELQLGLKRPDLRLHSA